MHWHIEYHESLKSTQDTLRMRLKSGVSEGLVIHAGEQTGGHGRHGRTWVSAPGNLYFSFVLKPDCRIRDVGQLAIVMGAALGRAVRQMTGLSDDVMVKWPNDVLIKGRKCAGILIETDLGGGGTGPVHVIVGMGINLTSAPDIGTALQDHTQSVPENSGALQVILDYVAQAYERWTVGDFDVVLKGWVSMAHQPGSKVSVKIGDQVIVGTLSRVLDNGAMVITMEDGQDRTITAGDVFIC